MKFILLVILFFSLALLLTSTLATKRKAAHKGNSAHQTEENSVQEHHRKHEIKPHPQNDQQQGNAHHGQARKHADSHYHGDLKHKHKHEHQKEDNTNSQHNKRRPILMSSPHCLGCLKIVNNISLSLKGSHNGSVSDLIQRNCPTFTFDLFQSETCAALKSSAEKLENLLSSQPTPGLICGHLSLCPLSRKSDSKHDDDDDEGEHHKGDHIYYDDDDDDEEEYKRKKKHAKHHDDDDNDKETDDYLENYTNCNQTIFCVESCDQLRQQEAEIMSRIQQRSHVSWWLQSIKNTTIALINGEPKEQPEAEHHLELQPRIPATCSDGTWSCPDGNLIPENSCFSKKGCRFPRPHHHMCKHHKWVSMGYCKKKMISFFLFAFVLIAIYSICYLFYRSVHSKRCNNLSHANNKNPNQSQSSQEESEESDQRLLQKL